MKSFHYVITDEVGIHARPAGMLAKEAKGFIIEFPLDFITSSCQRPQVSHHTPHPSMPQ